LTTLGDSLITVRHQTHTPEVTPHQLLALLDNTSAVIYMRSIDGRYMLVNAEYERLFGVHRAEIIGRTDHEIFPLHLADEFRANDLQAISSGRPIQVEETAPGDDGDLVRLSTRPVSPELPAWVAISDDAASWTRAAVSPGPSSASWPKPSSTSGGWRMSRTRGDDARPGRVQVR